MIDLSILPVIDFTAPSTIRLIPTAYIDEPAMDPLVDTEQELGIIEQLESFTSGRQLKTMPLPSDFSEDELLTERHGYGWTYINSAFCYTRSTGNRFNGPDRGAWYATWGDNAIETAQAEVIWHLNRELEATGVYENITDYRELIAGFTTQMCDLRDFAHKPFLGTDLGTAYLEGQILAKNLRATGTSGIIYPSVRHPNGLCLVAFRPNLVQNIRQGTKWRFIWDGSLEPKITSV